jgi:putative intracellular protease/amidase
VNLSTHQSPQRLISAFLAVIGFVIAPAIVSAAPDQVNSAGDSHIAPYHARFGRTRPVIAVVGENTGTELTDFVIPYGILAQSGAAEVITVATRPGMIKMRPALQIQPDTTIEEFDARFPDGADFVIVPAVVKSSDPVLLSWVAAQGAKGGTMVSICDGALVVAGSGLMNGHRATAHWATLGHRRDKFPQVQWVENLRYVADDGRIVSTVGVSAAIPASLALVEAIAGHEAALALAKDVGIAEWGTQHDSKAFRPRLGRNLSAFVKVTFTNGWFHANRSFGVPVQPGVDEIALALTADAYSRTGRSSAYSLADSSAPLRTRHGLTLVPDRVVGDPAPAGRILPAFDDTPSALWLDKALAGISALYGKTTAYGVAINFEYPGFKK